MDRVGVGSRCKFCFGNNQPLYVIDGTPIDNSHWEAIQPLLVTEKKDYGNTAADINPDDIESMSVFKRSFGNSLVWFTCQQRRDSDYNQKRERIKTKQRFLSVRVSVSRISSEVVLPYAKVVRWWASN